jgi:hypothetical protein
VFRKRQGISWLAELLLAFQEALFFIDHSVFEGVDASYTTPNVSVKFSFYSSSRIVKTYVMHKRLITSSVHKLKSVWVSVGRKEGMRNVLQFGAQISRSCQRFCFRQWFDVSPWQKVFRIKFIGKSKSTLSVFLNVHNSNTDLTNASFFNLVTLLLNTFGPVLHKFWYAFRIKCSESGAKPRMYSPLQHLVTGKTINSYSQLLRIIARTCSVFPPVTDVEGRLDCSASVTLVRPFRNISIHSHKVCVTILCR